MEGLKVETIENADQAIGLVAEIMNHYDLMIKPALKENNFTGIFAVVQTDLISLEALANLHPQIHASLKMGLTYLVGLSQKYSNEKTNPNQKLVDEIMDTVGRYFSEAELGLSEQPEYKRIRIKKNKN